MTTVPTCIRGGVASCSTPSRVYNFGLTTDSDDGVTAASAFTISAVTNPLTVVREDVISTTVPFNITPSRRRILSVPPTPPPASIPEETTLSKFVVVGGLPTKSASPTDVWILKLRSEIADGNAQKYVMKLFPTPETIPKLDSIMSIENPFSKTFNSTKSANYFKGLEYEIEVYNLIRDQLIFTRKCTNFVEIYSDKKESVNFEEMLQFLKGSVPYMESISGAPGSKWEGTEDDAVTNFYNNTLAMCFDKLNNAVEPATKRTSISFYNGRGKAGNYNTKDRKQLRILASRVSADSEKSEIDFLMNTIFTTTVDLKFKFVISKMANESPAYPPTISFPSILTLHAASGLVKTVYEASSLLLQTFCAGLAMSKVGIFHNDFHYGNAFVEISDTPRTVRYKITGSDGNVVDLVLTTRYKVRVFDFDRAFAKTLKRNPLVTYTGLCGPFHTCNGINFVASTNSYKSSPQVAARMEGLANILPIAAWMFGCHGSTQGGIMSSVIPTALSAPITSYTAPDTAPRDIRKLFTSTCFTNVAGGKFGKVDLLNARGRMSHMRETAALLDLRTETLVDKYEVSNRNIVSTKSREPFFTINPADAKISLNKNLYAWDTIFDSAEEIILGLARELMDNLTGGSEKVTPYEGEDDDSIEMEFDF